MVGNLDAQNRHLDIIFFVMRYCCDIMFILRLCTSILEVMYKLRTQAYQEIQNGGNDHFEN